MTKKKNPSPPGSVDPRNRMNDLDSRSWLKFQKSWFVWPAQQAHAEVAADFILFFTKQRNAEDQAACIGLIEENTGPLLPVLKKLGREAVIFSPTGKELLAAPSDHTIERQLDYALVEVCDLPGEPQHLQQNIDSWRERLQVLAKRLKPKAYLTIFTRNFDANGQLLPWAWYLGLVLSRLLSIKDEKIGCRSASGKLNLINQTGDLTHDCANRNETPPGEGMQAGWRTGQEVIYCLNFRREENESENVLHEVLPLSNFFSLTPSTPPSSAPDRGAAANFHAQIKTFSRREQALPPSWFVAKPPPREKNVLLHPAKFPESLVTYFLREFSQPGERIFDPMAGTGSALMAALAAQRQAYGLELNPEFHRIACGRVQKYLAETPPAAACKWQLACGDAAAAESYLTLPDTFDYVLTSPPYWDMLRMKGAETQQKRQQAGLLQFYSDDDRDLGNRSDYEEFLADLVKIYLRVAERLAPGRYMTIIVKNIKKRGKIYPLAWHLALRLRESLILCHEQFWCQDDQSLAPFGYRYAWVSNTFHHYCLHFRKPE